MGGSSFSLAVLAALIVLAPFAAKWWVRNRPAAQQPAGQRIVCVTSLSPQQRVVTIEAGPPQARVWLVLGVTPGSITTLHTTPTLAAEVPEAQAEAAAPAPARPFHLRLAHFMERQR